NYVKLQSGFHRPALTLEPYTLSNPSGGSNELFTHTTRNIIKRDIHNTIVWIKQCYDALLASRYYSNYASIFTPTTKQRSRYIWYFPTKWSDPGSRSSSFRFCKSSASWLITSTVHPYPIYMIFEHFFGVNGNIRDMRESAGEAAMVAVDTKIFRIEKIRIIYYETVQQCRRVKTKIAINGIRTRMFKDTTIEMIQSGELRAGLRSFSFLFSGLNNKEAHRSSFFIVVQYLSQLFIPYSDVPKVLDRGFGKQEKEEICRQRNEQVDRVRLASLGAGGGWKDFTS
ncbi:hypothetical protein F5880DRAFT_1512573, partial [Lentinula raphanica]